MVKRPEPTVAMFTPEPMHDVVFGNTIETVVTRISFDNEASVTIDLVWIV